MPERILIHNADYIYNLAGVSPNSPPQDILIEGNIIAAIGPKLDEKFGDVKTHIDATNKLVFPGFINTHHHLFQAFMRHVPQMQNQRIDQWIAEATSRAKKMDPEAHYWAALSNMAELVLSGATTTTDMLYLYPNQYDHQELFEATIEAAKTIGVRFHPYRGSMSRRDGLFEKDVLEESEKIIEHTRDIVDKFHQKAGDAMVKVGIAPCTIFTNCAYDYEQAAALAIRYDINLQTHLGESKFETRYVLEKYGMTPYQLMESLGWKDSRVSLAHCIEINDEDIDRLAQNHNSVSHCPTSNARSPIGQTGVAPIAKMLQKGVNVSIGVDGSAGNDSSDMLFEMRAARTNQGIPEESTYLDPEQIFYMATEGGAKALRWESNIGRVEQGYCADITIFDIHDSIGHIGAWDKAGSLISCSSKRAETVIINGEIIVSEGKLTKIEERQLIKKATTKWKEAFGK